MDKVIKNEKRFKMVSNILNIFALAILILLNEFSFEIIFQKPFGAIDKLRYLNLIILVSVLTNIIIFKVKMKIKLKIFLIFLIVVFLDYSGNFFNVGYKFNTKQEKNVRHKTPYDMFRGKPNVLKHNKFGFKGPTPKNYDNNNFIKIAFFAGSDGYRGNPDIAEELSNILNENNYDNKVFNFSSASSNHTQHLHRLVEFLDYKFDYVIFFGGINETLQYIYYDPRIGYPYNFFINELSPIKYFILSYSNIIGEIDKQSGLISGRRKLQKNLNDNPDRYNNITKYYFDLMDKTNRIVSNSIKPNICKETKFIGIFQPFNSNNIKFIKMYEMIQDNIKKYPYLFDYSDLNQKLVFLDEVHINQNSINTISLKIFNDLKISLNDC